MQTSRLLSPNALPLLPQVCNHPLLTYVEDNGAFNEMVIRQCGKMLILDRMLIKLFLTGHRWVWMPEFLRVGN